MVYPPLTKVIFKYIKCSVNDMVLLIVSLWVLFLLFALAVSSEFLAKGSEILEKKFGSGFTGSVIFGFITMLPELIFVLVAVKKMEYDVALGSAVGGNILLFTVGFGMVILVAYYKHKEIITLPITMKDDLWYLLIATLYILFTSLKGSFTIIDGIILILLYVIFVTHQYIETRRLEQEAEEETTPRQWAMSITFIVIGAIGLLITAEPFVDSIIEVSNLTGISSLILALIISPIASELPEKISAFSLSSKSLKGAEVAVANFIGSKVQASTLLFGTMIIYKLAFKGASFYIGSKFTQLLVAVLTTLVGVLVAYDLRLKLTEGILVTLLYIVSVAVEFVI